MTYLPPFLRHLVGGSVLPIQMEEVGIDIKWNQVPTCIYNFVDLSNSSYMCVNLMFCFPLIFVLLYECVTY